MTVDRQVVRTRRSPAPLLVRRGWIESSAPPAGDFREHRFAGGRVPSFVYRSIGTHCVDTAERVFAITYDDGPDPATTPQVLDVLARHGATATFFVLAEPVRRHPEIVRRIIDEGHEIALHGLDHRSLLTLTPSEASTSIARARDILREVVGRDIRLYRPPYGEYSLAHAKRVRRLGLDMTLWSGDARDWVDDTADAVAERAIAAVFPGAILLLHDTRADPENLGPDERMPTFDRAAVLDRILTATRAAGYSELRVGDLMTRFPRVKTIIRERMSRP